MGAQYEWRPLVGPRINHYDWSGLTYGSTTNLAYTTTLASPIASSSVTSIPLANASGLPSAGGIWLAGTTGKAGEYIAYTGKSTNTLTSATREPDYAANHGGVHASGETAYWFYPLVDNDGGFRITLNSNEDLNVFNWDGVLQGFKARHWAIRNNHLIAIQARQLVGPSENADWQLYFLGVIFNPTFTDTGNDQPNSRTSQWSLKIYSMDRYFGRQQVQGVSVGLHDLAVDSDVGGSPGLALAFDERPSGDFIAAEPSFSASSAADGDMSTLWIAERFVGTGPNYLAELPEFESGVGNGNVDRLKFDQIYVNPPPEAPALSKWIQLRYVTPDGDIDDYILYAAHGDTLITYEIPKTDLNKAGVIVICEDSGVFNELNPASEADLVLENPGLVTHLVASGGDLWLRRKGVWLSRVAWGDSSHSGNFPHPDAPGGIYGGGAIPAPGVGHTLRYLYDISYITGVLGLSTPTMPKHMWQSSLIRAGGYSIDESPQYIVVTFPGMGLHLRDDITSSVPGNNGELFVVDANGRPSTAGLPASATGRIGSEDITWVNKTQDRLILAASGARGANSTTAAAHKAGDPVYLRWGSGITDAHMFSEVSWWRHPGSTLNPVNFRMLRSPHINPRSPGTTDWEDDYVNPDTDLDDNGDPAVVTGYSMGHWIFPFPDGSPQRIKKLVFEISRMTNDPARPRLNEIGAELETGYYQSSLWLANGTTAGNLIKSILVQAGYPSNAITVSGGTPTLSNWSTAADECWKVVSDLANRTGCTVTVGWDSHITIAPNTFWTAEPPLSATKTWDETNAQSVDKVDVNDVLVSQVKVLWRTPDGSSTGQEVYPATPGIVGDVLELEDSVFANGTAAQIAARKRFYLAHFPFQWVIGCSDSEESVRQGQIHTVEWEFDRRDGEVERLCMVSSAEHEMREHHWYTTVNLRQIERVLGY